MFIAVLFTIARTRKQPRCTSVSQFNCSVVSDSLLSHEPQHPGLPQHHQHQESTQTHIHWVSDSIQPSHPLLSPSLPACNLSHHQCLFQWVSSSHHVAKVLEWSSASVLPMNIQDWFPLGWTVWISLLSKGLPRVFSSTTVQKHQFFGAQLSLWSSSHVCTWLLE